MATTLTLEGNGGVLQVEAIDNEYGWSRCYLSSASSVYLGAETAQVLLAKLSRAVAADLPLNAPSGEIQGLPVHWVLSLTEAHWSLYAAQEGDERLLLWQNDLGQPPTAIMRLAPDQQRQWQHLIGTFQAKLGRSRTAYQAAITKEIAEIIGGAEAPK